MKPNMRNNPLLWLIAIALLVWAAFKLGASFGAMRAEQCSLRNDLNDHRDDTHARLSSLETERATRERRWSFANKALALGKKLPVIRWFNEPSLTPPSPHGEGEPSAVLLRFPAAGFATRAPEKPEMHTAIPSPGGEG